ncbi:hypothetical protein C8Q77DRAFT_1070917 [Trametes polyzona]|nr:hypothetical protein C8Q77DRAFT_1070917 [Trametes polyzona]
MSTALNDANPLVASKAEQLGLPGVENPVARVESELEPEPSRVSAADRVSRAVKEALADMRNRLRPIRDEDLPPEMRLRRRSTEQRMLFGVHIFATPERALRRARELVAEKEKTGRYGHFLREDRVRIQRIKMGDIPLSFHLLDWDFMEVLGLRGIPISELLPDVHRAALPPRPDDIFYCLYTNDNTRIGRRQRKEITSWDVEMIIQALRKIWGPPGPEDEEDDLEPKWHYDRTTAWDPKYWEVVKKVEEDIAREANGPEGQAGPSC